MRRVKRIGWLVLLALSGPAWGCDVPVYRWALERWAPDPYPVVVFREGALDTSGVATLERLKAGAQRANLTVREVDVAAPMDDETRALWEAQRAAALPWLVVRHPLASPSGVRIWAGPLDEAAVDGILDSPKRREAARHLLAGDAVVWVLLDGDDAAAKALEDALADVVKNPPEPDPTPGGAASGRSHPLPRFPVVRVSRAEPAERVFAEMLLGVEPDLKGYAEPMAFPLFGRGRALYGLVGEGINAQTVRKACAFLMGGCSCEVKEQNPGMDVLLAVDWSRWDGVDSAEVGLPPLPGVPPPPVPEPPVPVESSGALLRNLVLAVGAGVALVAGASLVLWKRRDSRPYG